MDIEACTVGNPNPINIKTSNPLLYLINDVDSKVFIIKIKERKLLLPLPGSIGKTVFKGGVSLEIHIFIPGFIGRFFSLFYNVLKDKKLSTAKYNRFIQKYTNSHTVGTIDIAAKFLLRSQFRIHFTKAFHPIV